MSAREDSIIDLGQELDEILSAPHEAPQKRRFTRISWRVPVLVEHHGEVFPGQVSDVGVGGVAVEVDRPLEELTVLSLQSEAGHGPIRVRVRWCRPHDDHYRVDTALADTQENLARSWLKHVLMELGVGPASRDRRHEVRFQCHHDAHLVTSQGPQPVTVLNLGRGGCCLDVPGELPLTGVELRLGELVLAARVIWQTGPRVGLAFEGDRTGLEGFLVP